MLQAKVSELKTVIEQQKQNEEKLIIQMSQTILKKEQELEETKREMRFSLTPNAQKEMNDVDNCVLQDIRVDAVTKDDILTPAMMVRNDRINSACIFIPTRACVSKTFVLMFVFSQNQKQFSTNLSKSLMTSTLTVSLFYQMSWPSG
jgi:hypothetical protein